MLGPLLVTLFGAAGAVAAARLAPYAPYFFAGAAASLVFGFWTVYRKRAACVAAADVGTAKRPRLSRFMLWVASAIFIVSLAYSALVSTGRL